MAQNQKDLFEAAKKNLYTRRDLQEPVPRDYSQIKTFNRQDPRMQKSKTYSFIVDWQIPKIGKQDA